MSGAYLFMPSGDAVDAHVTEQNPTMYVIKGHILSQVIIQYSNVKHSVLLRHTKGNYKKVEHLSFYNIDILFINIICKYVTIYNSYFRCL